MTNLRLRITGCLAVTSALLSIPLVVLELTTPAQEWRLGRDLAGLVTTGLFVYLYVTLRELLNGRFGFHDVDGAIGFLVGGDVVLFLLGLLHRPSGEGREPVVDLAFVLLTAALGVGFVVFSRKLLGLGPRLSRPLRGFAYTNLVVGICLASIVLLPIAIVASVVADLVMGLVFFDARGR